MDRQVMRKSVADDEQTATMLHDQMRGMIANEIRTQMRPGGR
jgi:hypothetical protein